jgi:ATP-dependent Clp protease ATP-binding subunit ClpX
VFDEAMRRGTGARALRSILENAMLDIMFHLPSMKGVKTVVITKEVITNHAQPIFLYDDQKKRSA